MHTQCAASSGLGAALESLLKHFGIDKLDPEADIITINGVRFDGAVFRQLTALLPLHEPFRIVKRDDGVLAIERIVGVRSGVY